MGESTIERRKKKDDPPNPFSADAGAVRNQKHNQRVQITRTTVAKAPLTTPQAIIEVGLSDLEKKRRDALSRMSGTKPSPVANVENTAATSAADISNNNQKQQPSEKVSSRADRLAELREYSVEAKANSHKSKDERDGKS